MLCVILPKDSICDPVDWKVAGKFGRLNFKRQMREAFAVPFSSRAVLHDAENEFLC